MKLRHYLKGLGLGMAVTALILHFSVHAAEPSMTDEEVMARARELGMIENVVLSRNDPTISGSNVSGNDVSSASGNTTADDGVGAGEGIDPAGGEDAVVDGGHDTDASTDGDADSADISGQGNDSGTAGNGETSGEDPEGEAPPAAVDPEEETEQQEGMSGVEAAQNSVTITISNGDSSVSVAGRLAALGLVSSQAEYDAYLCSHGYDRSIRTGVHVIPEGATEQEIAEIITSKP